MIEFILNRQDIKTSLPPGSTVLDFVRYHKRLVGTKIGCREGDCGACTVLVGDIEDGKLTYRSMTSCLMPLGNAAGKHIVTVEGINLPAGRQGMTELSPVQQAMVDTNGTQCGFCTVGFVMSLTGFVMNEQSHGYEDAIKSIDGNICRCTGYKSIERAARLLSDQTANRPESNSLTWLAEQQFIPGYFTAIKERLAKLKKPEASAEGLIIGGGTDLVVQKHSLVKQSATRLLFDSAELKGIEARDGKCYIGASTTVTAFAESAITRSAFPDLDKHIKLVSSTPIRNMATLAGNLVNASPIGDMTVFLLALNAEIVLNNGNNKRTILLKDFYKGYKQLDRATDEFIEQILFDLPTADAAFSFEKVCKRTWLDIASVNCASLIKMNGNTIESIYLAAGGVAPFPKYLINTISFLQGKTINKNILLEAIAIMNEEIAPISDARGTAEYKRLLLKQLFLAQWSESRAELLKEILLDN